MNRKIIADIKIKKTRVFTHSMPEVKTEPKKFEIEKKEIKREESPKEYIFKRISRDPHLPGERKKSGGFVFILFFIVLLAGFVFWGSVFFEKVIVIITKKHQIFNLEQQTFTATKGLKSAILFEIMIVSDKQTENITFSKPTEVSLKAKGEVTLYNEYSKMTEKLAVHTYLSDENGKVYLTDKTVSLPGYTLKDNKIIPGEVTVSMTSFLPGEAYNGAPTDFTVNAYKGTPKFKKIYGKAKTVFSGGALGLNYSLDDKDKENLKNIADTSFKNNLLKKVNSLIPKEYIFYPEASSFSYTIDDNILSSTTKSKIDISGSLSVVLLNENNLKEAIIQNSLPKISDKELKTIQILGIKKLVFNFTEPNQTIIKELESVSFGLTGQLDFIWNPDIENLKNNLLNAPKENLPAIFQQDVGIGNASIKIFPPWQKILPLNPNKIKIKVF